MSRFYKNILLTILSAITISASAQMTGIQTIPGSFPSLQAAFTALNTTGVGSGGATINIAAGYTETSTGSLVLTMAVNPSSAANPLVIQRSGAGANPLITAYTGTTANLDGIIVLNGVDYVTINGIDLQENVANTTPTMQMEWGYALVKSAAANGASYNTIKNCKVTLDKTNALSAGIYLANHTSVSTTGLTVTTAAGTSSFNKFHNNTIQNCYNGISITGYASAAPYDFYDQYNEVGRDGVSTNRNQIINYGGAASTANGITATNQNGIKIFGTYINNSGGAGSTGALNGISLVTGTNSNVDVYTDTLTLSSASLIGGAMTAIANGMGGTGAGSVVNIYNNVIDGCTYPTNTSGEFRGISSTSTASYTNIYGNRVSNNIIAGTADFSGIYYGGANATLCLAVNINGNTVSGNSKTGTSGNFRMINANAATMLTNCFGNQLFNNAATASSGGFYGYYNFGIGNGENIYNNTIYNNAGGSGEVIMVDAATGSLTGSNNKEIYGNTIYGISGNTSAAFGAIYLAYGVISTIYNNSIYDITNNTTTGGVPAVFGINVANFINNQVNVHNNFISELKAPLASNTNAIYGIWLQGTTVSALNAYYNSVYLNATSGGANFGTAALVCGAAPASIDTRNNILVNVSTPAGTGTTRAFVRGNTTLTNYALLSGYNCLFAGTPGASNILFSDGTNNDQTLQAFKNRVGSREQASFSAIPPFINVAGSPYNLHLQTGIATQCEGGGTPIAGYAVDYDAAARNASTPDVGADEVSGITVDIASPNIQYILLTNSSAAATRSCAAFATITDPSGINTTLGTRPRIYYKKSTNANTYNTNTSGTDGWKYAEASNTSSPFSFTIDYTLLFGGGVVAGDIIQYFVVAQDLNGTPIFGMNNGGLTVQPASVNLSAANFPLNNTINQYTIVSAALSGVIPVGPAELITSLTNAGGIFQAINASVLSGNLTINITGDLTAETGTFALNQWAEEGGSGYTVSIVPSAATTRIISGNSAAASLIRFDGADRVNIDGRFAGAGSFLTFRNTSNAAPTIGFLNDAQNNIVQYSVIESGNTSTTTTLGGAVWIGTTTGANGNDNITINNNEIRDRSDVTGNPAVGINCVGTTGTIAQYNNNIVIANNNIHDWYVLNGTAQFAINIGVNNSGTTISGNSFYQTATRTHTSTNVVTRAINISFTASMASNGGNVITGNFIGGTAPGATGGDMTLTVSGTGTQAFGGISVISGLIPNSIQNNVIRKIDFTTNAPSPASTVWFGMNLGQGIHNVGNIAGNMIGDGSTTGSLKITINAGGSVNSFLAGILAVAINGSFNIQNNAISGITIAGTTTLGGIIPQWIQVQGTPSSTSIVTGNTIGSTITPNSIQNNATGALCISFGIRHITSTGAAATITNNTIQNITDNSTAASSANYAILMISTTGSTGTMNLSNNTIKDLTMFGGATTPVLGHMGIAVQGFAGLTHSINGNVISGLHAANTGATQNYTVGIQTQGSSLGGTMNQNRIYDLRNSNTGASPGLYGVYITAGLNWTINNNRISISNGSGTNTLDLGGIVEYMAQSANMKMYYNSIYLGGTTSAGAFNTTCYSHGGNSTLLAKNNLFYNQRTGGTGSHVAIANLSVTPVTGWLTNSSNYNAFVVSDTTKIGMWGATTYDMAGFRTISGGDANSIREINTAVTASALFVNAATGDLHINTSTFPEALATPLAGVTTDYDGDARSATFPTIGSDELPCSAVTASLASQTNVTCNGGNNGAVTLTPAGGNGFTYNWLPSGGTAATASGLTAGVYTCLVTNMCGNNTTYTVTITQPLAVTPSISAQTNVSCNGNADGSATVMATGGTGAFTYSWAPSGGTAATASSLTPNTYTCTITDVNGCSSTQTVTITEPAVLAASLASQTNVSCNAGTNGSATVSVTGGTTSYAYSWSPSGGTAATASSLAANTYTCTITDANSCSTTQTVTITEPTAIIASVASQTNVSCNAGNNGSATVTASGGTGAFSYSWAPSGGTAATASSLAANTYTCTITDANLCASTQVVTITEPTALAASLAAQTNVSCNGGTDGTATVSATGGTGTFTYSWSSGGTAAMETGLAVGTYTCTITDVNSCSTTQTVSITEPTVISVSTASSVDPGCSLSNGSVTVATTGGTGAYTYSWSSGGSAATETGLASGSYTVTVTDANTCSTNYVVSLSNPGAPSVTGTVTAQAGCAGESNGSIDVTITTGVGYTVMWSNSEVVEDIDSLTAGTYNITVTDINNCIGTDNYTITEFTLPAVSYTASSDTVCPGSSVTLSGTGAVSYVWDNAVSDGVAFSLNTTTTYIVTGTDVNGCMNSDTVTIVADTLPSVTFAPFVIPVCDNAAPFSMAGGSPSGGTYSGTGVSAGMFNPMAAGVGTFVITYMVTGANTCVNSDTSTITVDLCSGIAMNTNFAMNIYPNPSNGMFTLSISNANAQMMIISVVDIQGKEVFRSVENNISAEYTKEINLTEVSKGLYYIKLTTGNDQKIQKLIVH